MIAGIDIGSRATKLVVLDGNVPCEWQLVPTGIDPLRAAHSLLAGRKFEVIAATGYGRHLARNDFADVVLTEVKACAVGAHHVMPDCRLVIDVGGQDCKAIALDGNGGFDDFAMNDRCAAGTGRFLEVMAQTLGFPLDQFGAVALDAESTVRINSMCAVFAESEVTSLIARGADVRGIARGIHQASVERIAALVQGLGVRTDRVLLTGGVAGNPCICALLESRLKTAVVAPDRPQFIVALGAALAAGR